MAAPCSSREAPPTLRLARVASHLRPTAAAAEPAAAAAQDWNGAAAHLFADPGPDRLKDEWEWARTRVDLTALEAAVAQLPAVRRRPRVGIVGFALESNHFAPVVGKDDFSR
jgi:hypothetical protein